MLPYVIINGVSSKEINGLVIQSLAPITKPKMRTSVEEIEGRDGDIVTPLGFSAYDKQITIGLKGAYSVDDVLEYFNQSGKVTFSNEIEKYYNFAIYENIDLNRLVRFRTANITFHVQPFKYLVEELPLTWTNSGSETIATLRVRNEGNIYSRPSIKINGSGDVFVYLDSVQIFKIELGTNETIIIDDFNATDEAGNYLNRRVTGDYENFKLRAGFTDLRVTGNVTEFELSKYSRWI